MSSVKLQNCASCGKEEIFDSSGGDGPVSTENLRGKISQWSEHEKSSRTFDIEQSAYEKRLGVAASTLATTQQPFAESMNICWHCLEFGDLDRALDTITESRIEENVSIRCVLKKSTPTPSVEVPGLSKHISEAESAIISELKLEEELDKELSAYEDELKSLIEKHENLTVLASTRQSKLTMLQESIDSAVSQHEDINRQYHTLPRDERGLWNQFFGIDKLGEDYVTVCGFPLAILGTETTSNVQQGVTTGVSGEMGLSIGEETGKTNLTPNKVNRVFNATSPDAENIKSGMYMITALVARLLMVVPSEHPNIGIISSRSYRLWTNPPQIQERFGDQEALPLLPFSIEDGKYNVNFGKALERLLDTINTLFKFWNTVPQYPIGKDQILSPSNLILDLSHPQKWNLAMRNMCLNLKHLIHIASKTGALDVKLPNLETI